MTKIGELSVAVIAKTREFERGMMQSKRQSEQFARVAKNQTGNAVRGVSRDMSQAGRSATSLSRNLDRGQMSFSKIAKGAAAAGTAFVAAKGALAGFSSLVGGLGSSISLAADAEVTQVRLGVLMRDANTAKSLMGDLQNLAASTPFQLKDLAESARILSVEKLGKNSILDVVRRLGDVAALSGRDIKQLAALYAKMRRQTTIYNDDLNQLSDAGLPVFDELSKSLGMSVTEVKKLSSEGKVTFSQIEAAINRITGQGGLFSGGADRLSKTFQGKMSTLRDNLTAIYRETGQAIIEGFDLKDVLDQSTGLIQLFRREVKPVIVSTIKSIRKEFADAGITFSSIVEGAKNLVVSLAEIAKSLRLISGAAGLLRKASSFGNTDEPFGQRSARASQRIFSDAAKGQILPSFSNMFDIASDFFGAGRRMVGGGSSGIVTVKIDQSSINDLKRKSATSRGGASPVLMDMQAE